MAEQNPQMRPASKELAPDPASSYERAKPEKEAGMGRLDNNVATPTDSPDQIEQAVTHRQPSDRQINAHEVINDRNARPADGSTLDAPEQPDHSMLEEEPMGWDQAPTDINDPKRQRQPRTLGRGGNP